MLNITTIELSGPTATPRGQVKDPGSLPRVPNFINTFRFCMYWCRDEDVIKPDDVDVSFPASSEWRPVLDALFPDTPEERPRLNRVDSCLLSVGAEDESLLAVDEELSASLFLGPYLFLRYRALQFQL